MADDNTTQCWLFEGRGLDGSRRTLDARQSIGADADLFARIMDPGRETVLLSLPNGWAASTMPVGGEPRREAAETS